MRLIRNIALFSIVTTLFACSGLRNTDKNTVELAKTIVKITTSEGDIYIQLSDKAPKHKANFIKLAKEGFYDSLLFHRVMKGFMIQGGDPWSKNSKAGTPLGNGGPDYTIPALFDTTLYHRKGALAAARQPDGINPEKESSGSQFYIVQGKVYTESEIMLMEKGMKRRIPGFKFTQTQITDYTTVGGTPFLDQLYTVYGQVIKGMETVDKIANIPVDKRSRPKVNLRMKMEVLQLTAKEKAKLLDE
ncbi:MAG: cyclophilin family peptidyl-prolyl cis-trans isomerase [Urechidicola sp.]|jgi:cyclophilin family peptidyl-prolyl cis-trans isomerase|tara:strand:- start:236 stop:973 length:738 start_codon:yes stop_codon:yes gene_type:complete